MIRFDRYSKIKKLQVMVGSGFAAGLALTLAACGSSSTSSSSASTAGNSSASTTSAQHVTIAYVPGVNPFPYYDTAYRGAVAEAKKYGYSVSYVSISKFSPTVQTNALNAELAAKPTFLLVSPTDSVALRPVIQRYIDAGIPVMTVGGVLKDTSGLVAQIASNNAQGGQLAADYLGKKLNGTGTVVSLNIAPGNVSIEDRVTGFVDEMKSKFPNITVLPEAYGGGTAPGNEQEMRSLMLAHPGINGVFGAAETNAEGAAAAIAAVGKTGVIQVAAFDASPAEVAAVKSGAIDFLVVQRPAAQLALAVDYVHDYLTGQKSKIQFSSQISNIGATLSNIDSPSIKPLLYVSGS